jgi:hypothetical protein
LEVQHCWHPYFRYKVIVRRVERRADGLFYLVMGPTGSVISIAGWVLDPAICAGMTFGGPRADLAALVEMKGLLIDAPDPALCRSDLMIVP